jgi:undecaprenyl pyrophosphate phosphatase UppP
MPDRRTLIRLTFGLNVLAFIATMVTVTVLLRLQEPAVMFVFALWAMLVALHAVALFMTDRRAD